MSAGNDTPALVRVPAKDIARLVGAVANGLDVLGGLTVTRITGDATTPTMFSQLTVRVDFAARGDVDAAASAWSLPPVRLVAPTYTRDGIVWSAGTRHRLVLSAPRTAPSPGHPQVGPIIDSDGWMHAHCLTCVPPWSGPGRATWPEADADGQTHTAREHPGGTR